MPAPTLGLDFVGIELDEGYLKEAIERTGAALGQVEASAGGPPSREPPAAPARSENRKRKPEAYFDALGSGGGLIEYDLRDQMSIPGRLAFTSILRVRFSGSGLLE